MSRLHAVIAVSVLLAACVILLSTAAAGKQDASVERGRYLIQIGGCNDCHTNGYAPREGDVPESEWLLGDILGFRGAWGTTYPINLRLYMSRLSEDQWVQVARQMRSRPPMPWFNLTPMTDEDLRSIYRFVRTLEPLGDPAPAFVPPDEEPPPPYVQFP